MTDWTYWRRWGGDPLRVIQTFRTAPLGHTEVMVEGVWTAVPGDSLTALIYNGDPMVDRLSPEEVAELGIEVRDSPLRGDVPDFRASR